jgi:hypothetical protein
MKPTLLLAAATLLLLAPTRVAGATFNEET